jgi:CheY-like chemotaxis protein
VEDEPLIPLLVIDILSEAGFEVFEAQDSAEALTVLKSDEHIDVLLTDVRMPGCMEQRPEMGETASPMDRVNATNRSRSIEIATKLFQESERRIPWRSSCGPIRCL